MPAPPAPIPPRPPGQSSEDRQTTLEEYRRYLDACEARAARSVRVLSWCLAIAAALLVLGVVVTVSRGQEELPAPAPDGTQWNPHHGLDHLFVTSWQHRGGTRYEIPQSVADVVRTLQWTNATLENTDRPGVSKIVPTLVNARKPLDRESWRILEPWRYEYQPLQGGGRRWVRLLNVRDVSQWRLHHPAESKKPETYTILFDFHGRDHVDLFPILSQINYASFGDAKRGIRVWGGGSRIDVGEHITIRRAGFGSPEPRIQVNKRLLIEADGQRFLPIHVEGKRYGIRLETLPDVVK